MTRHVIPRLASGKVMVGGPGYALNPVWERSDTSHAVVRCMCGHLVEIPTLKIDPMGAVWGEIECPTSSCGWRVMARLEGWGAEVTA
jgi:hypothetical protein